MWGRDLYIYNKCFGFFSIIPYLYYDAEPIFGSRGIISGSDAGGFYDHMLLFAREMGFTDYDYLKMPIRRRRKLATSLQYYLEIENARLKSRR